MAQQPLSNPLFGIVPAGLPVFTEPASAPSPTSFLYNIPTTPRPFSHIVVFLLPGVSLPPDTAAAIYLAAPSPSPSQAQSPTFRFLGGVGPGKESAVFKLNSLSGQDSLVLGISVEDAASVSQRITELAASRPDPSSALVHVGPGGGGGGGGGGSGGVNQPSTLVLAQRIIRNAFNFLASFSGGQAGVEVVPLRAFEEWWRKFESRVRSDPGFLERDD